MYPFRILTPALECWILFLSPTKSQFYLCLRVFSSNLPNCLDIFIGPPSVKSGLNLSCQANAGVSFIHTYTYVGKSNFFSKGMFLYRGFSLLKSEHPLFLHFPRSFFKAFFVEVEAFQTYFILQLKFTQKFPQKLAKKRVFTFRKYPF